MRTWLWVAPGTVADFSVHLISAADSLVAFLQRYPARIARSEQKRMLMTTPCVDHILFQWNQTIAVCVYCSRTCSEDDPDVEATRIP